MSSSAASYTVVMTELASLPTRPQVDKAKTFPPVASSLLRQGGQGEDVRPPVARSP